MATTRIHQGVVVELVEIIRGAQDAMDRGDYRRSAAASRHVLETFPSSLTAHRMLGESLLELGETDKAIAHFQQAIAIDPLNVVARLGLGVASEEKRDMNQAYTAYLHAWEINPALDQVRDELVRLRGLLGGSERLHPTRAGLAGIFARGGQFGRAAAEWRAVLLAEPESRRARTSLAEVHWRSGDDTAALNASREALNLGPENVRALALVAEVETRRGMQTAPEFVERYQFADPVGEIMTLMQDWRDDLDLSFLRRESAHLADFDFSATPLEDRTPVPVVAAATVAGLGANQFAAPDLWDSLVQDLKPGDLPAGSGGSVQADVQPFAWFEDGDTASLGNQEPFSLDGVVDPSARSGSPAGPDSFELEFAGLGGPTGPGTQPIFEPMPHPTPIRAEVVAPQIPAVPTPAPKAAKEQFVNADGGIDLTVGWDDLDRQLKEATPNFESSHEMDALIAQLGVDGLQPFEVADSPFDESAWAPFTDDELPVPPQRAEPPVAAQSIAPEPFQQPPVAEPIFESESSENAAAQDGWKLDHEFLAAIPGQRSSGYTELFRNVDTEFPSDGVLGEAIDPFANPDSAGMPLDFEDLLAVTSRDGTAPLRDSGAESGFDGGLAADTLIDSTWDTYEPISEVAGSFDSLVGESPYAFVETPAPSSAPMFDSLPAFDSIVATESSEESDPGLSALFADFGDLQPFSVDDNFESHRTGPISDSVDFSEINEAPFDPAKLPKIAVAPSVRPVATEPSADWGIEGVDSEAHADQDEWVPEATEIDGVPEVEVEQEPVIVFTPGSAQKGGLGVRPGGVAWPAFVNHTSELIDRGSDGGNLFLRLRENKRAASAAGILQIDRSVVDLRPSTQQVNSSGRATMHVVPTQTGNEQTAKAPTPLRAGWMTEEERLDLMAMRVRLIDDDESAREIAGLLEVAVSRGLSDPLALRVLGEAYLKLGQTDQAAAQFRHAMLERRRAR